jgi:dTDP-4-dehydrorhamnose 3,5-epimerase
MIYENEYPTLLPTASYEDNRGLLQVVYEQEKTFCIKNVKLTLSKQGVLRGFHGQIGVNAERKIITVVEGIIQDVCMKLDLGGKLTGKIFEEIIDASVMPRQLLIPRGWVHGYLTLSESSKVLYLCDNHYGDEIVFNPIKNFKSWKLQREKIIISTKDVNGN